MMPQWAWATLTALLVLALLWAYGSLLLAVAAYGVVVTGAAGWALLALGRVAEELDQLWRRVRAQTVRPGEREDAQAAQESAAELERVTDLSRRQGWVFPGDLR